MLPFDLVFFCLSADVKHSYKLGKLFFCADAILHISWRKCNIVELDLNCLVNSKWIKCFIPIGLDDLDCILVSVSFIHVFKEHTQLYLSIILKFNCMQFQVLYFFNFWYLLLECQNSMILPIHRRLSALCEMLFCKDDLHVNSKTRLKDVSVYRLYLMFLLVIKNY